MGLLEKVYKEGIQLVRTETLRDETMDFDCYIFIDVSPLSSKDVSIVVDFKDNTIEGDVVAYGDWHDLEYDEIQKYVNVLEDEDILRDFQHIKEECDKKQELLHSKKSDKKIINKELE